MELWRIVINDLGNQYYVFLRESEGPRSFPIIIGPCEATSIDRRVRKEIPLRPLTHDLLKTAIEGCGGEVHDIIITDLRDHTYYAVIRIEKDGELIEIDSRPSDAIALSVHFDPPLPIFVNDEILDEVA
jgi:bifunctional DNase/RNase